jgi:lysozyme family protein
MIFFYQSFKNRFFIYTLMTKVSKYQEFLLEKEFNKLVDEIFRIVESEGKWTSDNTYEWDLTDQQSTDVEDYKPDWIDHIIDKTYDFIKKLPTDKIKEYFIRLVNKVKSLPEGIRRKLLIGYLSAFLAITSYGYLTSTPEQNTSGQKIEQIDQKIKVELEEINQKVFQKNKKSSFEESQKLVKSVEAGYSDDRGDTGNWITIPGYGQRFVGTNHGISAPVLQEYLGRYPKKEDMQNLSYETALKIYKSKYWDAQNLSEFSNQSVANIVYDGCVNQGEFAMKDMLRQAYLENGLDIGSDSPYSKASIQKANKLNQQKLFNSIKDQRETNYRQAATWNRHGEGWLNRLNGIEFRA